MGKVDREAVRTAVDKGEGKAARKIMGVPVDETTNAVIAVGNSAGSDIASAGKMSRSAGPYYLLLNGLFHLAHLSIILFVMLAWLVPALRPWHLLLTTLTLGCWFVLGYWLSVGYCPVSDWHWKIKQALGSGRPPQSYIHFVLQKISGRRFDGTRLDQTVVVCTILLLGLSLWLNLQI